MICTVSNEYLTVSADTLGAELCSILSADGTEYLWQGDERFWKGRAPNLFPYVGRLYGGKYTLDGEEYSMRLHGFAPVSEFECEKLSDTAMRFTLEDNAQTYALYPRRFRFAVRYELAGSTLSVTFTVENRDDRRLYFGLGGHPGFNVPLVPGRRFEDHRLSFGKPCEPVRIGFNDAGFRDGSEMPYPLAEGRYIPLEHELFDHDAVVLKGTPGSVTLECPGDGHSVTVTYPGMEYVGFWHCAGQAPYVCVEPWCSLPSEDGELTVFERKSDLLSLEPAGAYNNTWTVSVK